MIKYCVIKAAKPRSVMMMVRRRSMTESEKDHLQTDRIFFYLWALKPHWAGARSPQ